MPELRGGRQKLRVVGFTLAAEALEADHLRFSLGPLVSLVVTG